MPRNDLSNSSIGNSVNLISFVREDVDFNTDIDEIMHKVKKLKYINTRILKNDRQTSFLKIEKWNKKKKLILVTFY